MRVLYVCTANICRSVAAAQVLCESLSVDPVRFGVEVRSAGTMAVPGMPGCSAAGELLGSDTSHQSQPLTPELVEWADLILTAARDHRGAVASLVPVSRQRTFTIRQAGRIAEWLVDSQMVTAGFDQAADRNVSWADRFLPGDPRLDVAPMPVVAPLRARWLITEMDAARGMMSVGTDGESDLPTGRGVRRLWRERSARHSPSAGTGLPGDVAAVGLHPDDVPDPHVLDIALHPVVVKQLREATQSFARLLEAVYATADLRDGAS